MPTKTKTSGARKAAATTKTSTVIAPRPFIGRIGAITATKPKPKRVPSWLKLKAELEVELVAQACDEAVCLVAVHPKIGSSQNGEHRYHRSYLVFWWRGELERYASMADAWRRFIQLTIECTLQDIQDIIGNSSVGLDMRVGITSEFSNELGGSLSVPEYEALYEFVRKMWKHQPKTEPAEPDPEDEDEED